MILTRINGGLGNQLFGYAAGRALAARHGVDLKLDIRHYPDSIGREYELDNFPITIAGQAVWEDCKAGEWQTPSLFQRAYAKIIGKRSNGFRNCGTHSKQDKTGYRSRGVTESRSLTVHPETPLPRHSHTLPVLERILKRKHAKDYLNDKGTICTYLPRFETLGPNAFLDGYFQSEKYFADIADTIRQELGAPLAIGSKARQLASAIAASECAVSLHVRRGDYVSNPATTQFHGLCSMEYYQCAVKKMCASFPDAHFFIFSDEPEWVIEHLHLDAPMTVIPAGNTGVEDMWLMSQCSHHIIANSSFSWWGAWLNPNQEKKVIAPKKWFGDNSINTTDLIPVGWERI